MKTLSMFGVMIIAHLLVLMDRDLAFSFWTPFAYLWQDVLVAILFAVLEFLTCRRPWIAWSAYTLIAGYVALNVPVECVLSTPLTWPILRAAGGTLSDSIAYHVTPLNLLRMGLVLGSAAVLPLFLGKMLRLISFRARLILAGLALAILLLGPLASRQVATVGLGRNPLVALFTTAFPRITANEERADWRLGPFGSPRRENLAYLHGSAAGRNVVVVHLESTGARYLGLYGASNDPMPRFTELARHGILFDNAYTTYPETIRSFFATQCALFPALDTPAEIYGRPFAPGLGTMLTGAGYRTSLFHSGRFMYLGMNAAIQNRGYETLEDAGAIGGEHDSSFGIDEASTVRRLLHWVDDLPAGAQFLVSYLPIAGHHPYFTPEPGPFPEETELDRYRNALHYSDAALGQLLDGLAHRGLLQNTLLIIFGDHGEAFGQHAGNYAHSLFLYEENVHVPLLIAAPGLFGQALRVERVASLVDVAPTVLDLLGLSAPEGYQGRSLLGDQTNLALFCTDYSLGFLGLRDGRWKMIHELESGRNQLYDLELDPQESRDLSEDNPERVVAYRDHLLRWAAAQKYLINTLR